MSGEEPTLLPVKIAPFLAATALLATLASCSGNGRRVHIISKYNKVETQESDSGIRVRLSDPGIYEVSKEVEYSGKKLILAEGSQNWSYELPEKGQYVLNLLDDTLMSVPATYSRNGFGDAGRPVRPTHSGNATIDSMTARTARAQQRHEQRESDERLRDGRSNVLTVLPGKMERISAHNDARLFVFSTPPAQVKGESANDFEYYEINRYSIFLKRAMQQLRDLEQERDPARVLEERQRAIKEMLNDN